MGARILQIAAIRKLVLQTSPHADRRVDRPRAIGIDAQRIRGAKFFAKSCDRRDFEVRRQHAALQLDLAKAVSLDHLPGFAHRSFRIEHFAVFVFAPILAEPAATSVLIKEIRRK